MRSSVRASSGWRKISQLVKLAVALEDAPGIAQEHAVFLR
jgi:hypothetical protein